jgi:hypothetical protein
VRWLTLCEKGENTFVTNTKKYYVIYVAGVLRLFEISMVAIRGLDDGHAGHRPTRGIGLEQRT